MRTGYEEAVNAILSIPGFAVKNPPEHTRYLLKKLGDPQEQLKMVHVAGTNGKGSVCCYVQAMLLAAGRTTGLFVSPHLVRINERIRMNGIPISDEAFTEGYMQVQKVVDQMQGEGFAHPSYFEFLLAMALLFFAQHGMEYAVIETGLGGTLDATNAVEHPVLSVITSIGLDHTDILGHTIEEIAANKAGIIKPGVPVIYAGDPEEAADVIRQVARKKGAPCTKITKDAAKILESTAGHIAFRIRNSYDRIQIAGTGQYQIENAMIALESGRQLLPEVGEEILRRAVADTTVPGRMEEIYPGVILDGAHNTDGIREWLASLPKPKHGKRVVLFSALQDKQYEEMIRLICNHAQADLFILVRIRHPRALALETMERLFSRKTTCPILPEESVCAALETGRAAIRDGGNLYIVGSLYLAGEIKAQSAGGKENA